MTHVPYLSLRVYRQLSTVQVLNNMLCNRLMKSKNLVENSSNLYNLSNRIFGSKLTQFVLNSTFCQALTAGNTLQEANEVGNRFRRENIAIILDYCAQGHDGETLEKEDSLDANANLFAETANLLSKFNNEMISVKVTALIPMKLLKKFSTAVTANDKIWEKCSHAGRLDFQGLVKGLSSWSANITASEIEEYVRVIHEHVGPMENFSLDQVGFKMAHHPFYVFDLHKNQNTVLRALSPLTKSQISQAENMARRLKQICEPHKNNDRNFRILVDAEQSYVQTGIESISEQLQANYNQKQLFVIPTIQNYLKRSPERTAFEVEIAKRRNLFMGAKLVRGAYIVEERRLAEENGYDNPIVPRFNDTTINYMGSFKRFAQSGLKGQIVVATHNQQTIKTVLSIYKEAGKPEGIRLSFAQLLGLADHLTWSMKMQNYQVYKYLPWAAPNIMVAYMIRRAQELSQMRYPLDLQFNLLKHELKCRILFQ